MHMHYFKNIGRFTMLSGTKKFIAVIAAVVMIPTTLYGGSMVQNYLFKQMAQTVTSEQIAQLVADGKIDKEKGKKLITMTNEFTTIYLDSMGVFAPDPTEKLGNWYKKNKDFILTEIDKNLSKKDKITVIHEIEKIKKNPPKEYFSFPDQTKILLDNALEDVQKRLEV